jgi:hypothetical protein
MGKNIYGEMRRLGRQWKASEEMEIRKKSDVIFTAMDARV